MALVLSDKTANGNDLTNVGVAEWTSDTPFAQSTKAGAFVRSQVDYLWAADSASLSITGDMSLEVSVKFDSLPGSGAVWALLSKWSATANQNSFSFYVYNDAGTRKLYFDVSSTGSNLGQTSVSWSPSQDTWYVLGVTYKASTGKVNFYVNGSLQGTEQTNALTSIYNGTAKFAIGIGDDTSLDNPFDGKLDEIRVWNATRSAVEMSANYNIHLAGNESGLAAYYPLEDLSTAYTKEFNEEITMSETFTKALTRSFSDTVTISEDFVKSLGKYLTFSEVITLSDTFSLSNLWRKILGISSSYSQSSPATPSFTKENPTTPSFSQQSEASVSWTKQNATDPDWEE